MDSLFLLLRVLVSLAAVFGLLFYLRKKLPARFTAPKDEALKVISRQAIGPKSSVVLVEACGSRYLLGVSDSAVNVLDSMPGSHPVGPGRGDESLDFAEHEGADEQPTAGLELPAAIEPAAGEAPTASQPVLRGRRTVPEVVDFDAELRRHRAELPEPGPLAPRRAGRPSLVAGSILDAQTWRDAGQALRQGPKR